MPILRCDYQDGMVVEIEFTRGQVPRVQNAIRLPDLKITDWDAMTKSARAKLVRDYEWFSQKLTKAKINHTRIPTAMTFRNIGGMKGNK